MDNISLIRFINEAEIQCILPDHNGHGKIQILSIDAAETKQLLAPYQLILVIPGYQVLLTNIELPKMSPKQQKMAIPFALEKKLIKPMNNQIYRIGQNSNNHVNVAVIDKSTLQNYAKKLQSFKLQAIYPESLFIPNHDSATVIVELDNYFLVKMKNQSVFSIEANNFADIANNLFINEKNNEIIIYQLSNGKCNLEELFSPMKLKFKAIYYQNILELAQQNLHSTDLIDLYAQNSAFEKSLTKNKFLISTGLLGVGVALLLTLSSFTEYEILKRNNLLMQQRVFELYKKIFPDATTMVKPKLQIQEFLEKQQFSEQKLFNMISDLSNILITYSNIKIQNIDYKKGQFLIKLTANDFSQLDELKRSLAKNQFSIKQISAQKEKNYVATTWELEKNL